MKKYLSALPVVLLSVSIISLLIQFRHFTHNDRLHTDLTAFNLYAKNGWHESHAQIRSAEQTEWEFVRPPHSGIFNMSHLPATESSGRYGFLSTADRLIEQATVFIPFVIEKEKYEYLRGENILPAFHFASIGENWEVFVNGISVARNIYLDENGGIYRFRSMHGVSIPFHGGYLNEGENALVIRIIGARSSKWSGMSSVQPYHLINSARVLNNYNSVAVLATCAILVIAGFYLLLFFALNRILLDYFFLGGFAVILSVYYFSRSPVVYYLVPNTLHVQRLEYTALYFVVFMAVAFLDYIKFEKVFKSTLAYGAVGAVFSVVQLFFPVWFMYNLLVVWQIGTILFVLYFLVYFLILPVFRCISELKESEKLSIFRCIRKSGISFVPVAVLASVFILNILDASILRLNTISIISQYSYVFFTAGLIYILAKKSADRYETATRLTKSLEEVVKQRTHQLEEQVELAETAMRVKDVFLTKMSHEIRTPLNTIMGMSELIRDEKLTNAAREYSYAIKIAGENLLSMVTDILDFSKMNGSKFAIVPKDYLFTSLVTDVISIINIQASDAHLRFTADIAGDIPDMLYGDSTRIRQILLNLLGNAVKFTEEGFVSFHVSCIHTGEEYIELIISVEDSGKGIKKEDISSIFKEFTQVDSVTAVGTGLGLAITHNLVEAMGGEISVASEYGKGSIFTIQLPQKVSANDIAQDTGFIAPEASVLVVDDIEVNLMIAEGLMQPYEMKIDLRESGIEAIEAVKANRYDLIMMDHMMPEMDGIETVARIRELGATEDYYKNVPVVALTANAVVGMKEMFLENGFNDFLSKPIDTNKLGEILRKWIPKQKQEKQSGKPDIEIATPLSHDIKVTGVDINKGVAMAGGTLASYLDTLAVFHRDLDKKIRELGECLKTDNLDLYMIHVHALKSAAANVGAEDISKTAGELEIASRQKDVGFINRRSGQFLADLKTLLSSIAGMLAEQANDAPKKNVDAELLKAELLKLKEGLETFDSGMIEEASENLQEYINAENIGEIISDILQQKLIGKYDETIELIEGLISRAL